MSRVDVPARSASFVLDDQNPTALTRIVVRINAEASSGFPRNNVTVKVNSVKRAQSAAPDNVAASAVRIILAAAAPGVLPTPEPSLTFPQPIPTPWQAAVAIGSEGQLPLQCGVGPCERAFWLIAQLTDPDIGPVEIDWSVGGGLEYSGSAWPSGAGASIEIGEPVLLAGSVAQLAVSTEPESVTLGPANPAFARIVEVSVGSNAIPGDGRALAALSIDLLGQPAPHPAIAIYPLDANASGPTSTRGLIPTSAPGMDPFSGCMPGGTCTRRFLVTMAWTGGLKEQQFEWQLTARRVDLTRVWSTAAELTAQIERRFDVVPESASTTHFEGEEDAFGPLQSPTADTSFGVRSSTTSTDPLARLLPVPAILRYSAEIVDPIPPPSADVAEVSTPISLPIPGQAAATITYRPGNQVELVSSAMASQHGVCRIAEHCPDLRIGARVSPRGPNPTAPAGIRVKWTLDLTVYSYTEVPVSLAIEER